MSVRLNVGDAVLVNTNKDTQGIGVIKYIGCIHGCDMTTEYVGIELTESIQNGHSGTIAGYQYFSSPNGHGFHTKLGSVIRKMLPSELVIKLRYALTSFKKQISAKEKYIERLESKILSISKLDSNPRTNHVHFDLAGSSKRTSLVSGASGYLPRRESLSLTTVTESFMLANHPRELKRQSTLDVIDETKLRIGLKNRTGKTQRRQRKNTTNRCSSLSALSDHECTSSESGYSSSSSEYTADSLSDDEEFSNNSTNTMKRQSTLKSVHHNHSQQSINEETNVAKKLKKIRRKVRKKIGDKANILKDRRHLRRISDSVTETGFNCPTIAMQRNNSLSRQESMVKLSTNMQQIRDHRMTHNHARTPVAHTQLVHHGSNDSLPPKHPQLMRPASSPVFKTDPSNSPTHQSHAQHAHLSPHTNTSSSHTNMFAQRNHQNQQSSSTFVDVSYLHEPSFYHSHNNQSSHSFNQFGGIQSMQSLHSNQSSTTITVPSHIDLWSNPLHHRLVSGASSPVSVPHTPQHVDNVTMSSETQTAYFDNESFLNQHNQRIMQQQHQQQQLHQLPSYPIVSIKYNSQMQSQQRLPSKRTGSAIRTGQRTNVQSVRTSPTRSPHARHSPPASTTHGTVASNVALYGDSISHNSQRYAHHKIYSLPNPRLHIFGNNYKESQSNTLSK